MIEKAVSGVNRRLIVRAKQFKGVVGTGRAVQAHCGASGGVSVTKGPRSAWQAWQRQDQTRQAHMMLRTQVKAGQVAVWTVLSPQRRWVVTGWTLEPSAGRKGAGQALLSLQQRQEQVLLPPKKQVWRSGVSWLASPWRPATPTQQSYYSKKVLGVGTGEGVNWVTLEPRQAQSTAGRLLSLHEE